jgi:hypothetical protein
MRTLALCIVASSAENRYREKIERIPPVRKSSPGSKNRMILELRAAPDIDSDTTCTTLATG